MKDIASPPWRPTARLLGGSYADRQYQVNTYNPAGASEFLACPSSRVYSLVSARRIPHHRDGSRLLFRRSELDEWVQRGGAKRP
jgi:excisionase family DNA binding protein